MKYFLILTILFGCSAVEAQIAVGGSYKLDQSVIAAGGGTSSGGVFRVEGTVGQAAAGTKQNAAQFNVQTGFWTAAAFAPTAASVIVGGRVTTANGRGIRNARITLTGAAGETRTTVSGAFGYFQFSDV